MCKVIVASMWSAGRGTEISVPKQPVLTMVRIMGRHSGHSGRGFEKPGSVRLKLLTAAKARRCPGNLQISANVQAFHG